MESKNELLEAVNSLIEENTKLTEANEVLKGNNERLKLRESIYQKELSKVRATLQGLAQVIDTTPHARDAEYQEKFYKDNLTNETVS